MRKHTRWKKSEVIILSLLGVIVLVAIIMLCSILLEYADGKATYKSLQKYVLLPEDADIILPEDVNGQGTDSDNRNREPEQNKESDSDVYGRVYYGQPPQVDFEALKTMNSDVTGWIYGPGTLINYPIVQGDDNSYYLTHMFDGRENKCGTIFMDSLNEENFSNTNNILHGHHMKNGSMFASLTGYSSQAYYDAHPVMWLATPEKTYRVDIFTGFVTDAESDVWQLEFADKEDYRIWLDKMTANGVFQSDIRPGTDDRIITLATCSYEYDNSRFVVMGILREME